MPDQEEVITAAAKRDIIQRRIAQLETELFNFELNVIEFRAVAATSVAEKTDAVKALMEAEVGVKATKVRLDVLRLTLARMFPNGVTPDTE